MYSVRSPDLRDFDLVRQVFIPRPDRKLRPRIDEVDVTHITVLFASQMGERKRRVMAHQTHIPPRPIGFAQYPSGRLLRRGQWDTVNEPGSLEQALDPLSANKLV